MSRAGRQARNKIKYGPAPSAAGAWDGSITMGQRSQPGWPIEMTWRHLSAWWGSEQTTIRTALGQRTASRTLAREGGEGEALVRSSRPCGSTTTIRTGSRVAASETTTTASAVNSAGTTAFRLV